MQHKNQSFIRRLSFALHGLRYALRAERSLRFQLVAFAAVMVAMLVLRPEPLWWGLVLLVSAGVITAELMNTALEELVDHLHPEIHPRIKVVKDCAAAAVLVASAGAIGVAVALLIHLLTHPGH